MALQFERSLLRLSRHSTTLLARAGHRTFSSVTASRTTSQRPAQNIRNLRPTTYLLIPRRYDSQSSAPRILGFSDVLHIITTPSSSTLLIDVREPHEFEADTIPTAINIPVTSQPDAMLLSEEDFEDRFGFQKPSKGKEIVVFCKAGVRSRAAAGLARGAGYTNVAEYPGSWLDWTKNGGPTTKNPPTPGGMGEPNKPITEMKPTGKPGDSGVEDLGPDGQVKYPKGSMGRQ